MSYIDINAYNCTCERCSHTWSTFKLPLTCAKCRSPYWDIAKGAVNKPMADLPVEKKPAEASPDKKETLSNLQSMINSIVEKPKSDYHTKSVLPEWKPQEDQPSYEDNIQTIT